jgi:hypothetical protein
MSSFDRVVYQYISRRLKGVNERGGPRATIVNFKNNFEYTCTRRSSARANLTYLYYYYYITHMGVTFERCGPWLLPDGVAQCR